MQYSNGKFPHAHNVCPNRCKSRAGLAGSRGSLGSSALGTVPALSCTLPCCGGSLIDFLPAVPRGSCKKETSDIRHLHFVPGLQPSHLQAKEDN